MVPLLLVLILDLGFWIAVLRIACCVLREAQFVALARTPDTRLTSETPMG
jgi:hypothetical protein